MAKRPYYDSVKQQKIKTGLHRTREKTGLHRTREKQDFIEQGKKRTKNENEVQI